MLKNRLMWYITGRANQDRIDIGVGNKVAMILLDLVSIKGDLSEVCMNA